MIAQQKIASMEIELPAMSEPNAMYDPLEQTGKLAIHGHWKRHSPLLRYV